MRGYKTLLNPTVQIAFLLKDDNEIQLGLVNNVEVMALHLLLNLATFFPSVRSKGIVIISS